MLLAAGNLSRRTQFYCNVNVVHEAGGVTGWSEIYSPTDELDCVKHTLRASPELSRANAVTLPDYCCKSKEYSKDVQNIFGNTISFTMSWKTPKWAAQIILIGEHCFLKLIAEWQRRRRNLTAATETNRDRKSLEHKSVKIKYLQRHLQVGQIIRHGIYGYGLKIWGETKQKQEKQLFPFTTLSFPWVTCKQRKYPIGPSLYRALDNPLCLQCSWPENKEKFSFMMRNFMTF